MVVSIALGEVQTHLKFHKVFILRDLRQITVIGMGLLGSSITLTASRAFNGVKTVGYAHRESTCRKARQFSVADHITSDIAESVKDADLVILATPICTFEKIFTQIAEHLPDGCIVTDVGSTKKDPLKWAGKILGKNVVYAGSHPIAGSEQSGLEFARDDLFYNANCILTVEKKTNPDAVEFLENFWEKLGCYVKKMSPAEHDRIFGQISHVPHIVAASLTNASSSKAMKFSGKGFIDTSRIASGPANVWSDILLTNRPNCIRGIDNVIGELEKIRQAIEENDRKKVEQLLEKARGKRAELIDYKIKQKELI